MAVLLFILFILAIYHLIYESIIMPSVRLKLRYDLFEWRDKLIYIQCTQSVMSEKDFNLVHSYINAAINRLPYYSLSLLFRVNKDIERNPHLRKQVEHHSNAINAIDNKDVQEIIKGVNKTTLKAFWGNFGAWALYLIPILIVLILLLFCVDSVRSLWNTCSNSILALIYTPNKEFQNATYDYINI